MSLASAFLRDQIPMRDRALIPTTLQNAYKAAEMVRKDQPILNVASARDNWGRLTQWAVDLGFQKLVESGRFGNSCRWRQFERPTGRYLEVAFSHSVLTISQVENPRRQPREARFRRNKALASQITMREIIQDEEVTQTPHILLLHGYQDLNFAYLAIPDPDHRRGYQYRTANLCLMPHEISSAPDEAPVEQTDIDLVMSIKEEIDRMRRDGDV